MYKKWANLALIVFVGEPNDKDQKEGRPLWKSRNLKLIVG